MNEHVPALERRSGLLLHPTSLPGRFGIGDLGPALERFLDRLAQGGQSLWQILPLVPPAGNGSPYDALSAFAGNPLLISPERLLEDGLLDEDDLAAAPSFPPDRVDFAAVEPFKEALLRHSWRRLDERRADLRQEMSRFRDAPEQRPWLEDWALFCALKERFGGVPWTAWEPSLKNREPAALDRAREELAAECDYHRYLQFIFFRQWERARRCAGDRGVRVVGDLPIYVSLDSADVWTHADLFDLDPEARPIHVAGVPPDYFSDTGQRWGNPLYRWDRLEETGYRWWIERLRANLRLADLVRLDHFRGFAACWQIDADQPTAVDGRWVPGPGEALFDALREALGPLPLIAEDLGETTDDVHALRDAVGLPGMRILQFGFDDPGSFHAPHHLNAHTVVYTGTHDNDTAVGWYRSLDGGQQEKVRTYLGVEGDHGGEGVAWALIRQALTSVSRLAIVPLQDVLGLGEEARMNTPGEAHGNWAWRMSEGSLSDGRLARLRRLTELGDRLR